MSCIICTEISLKCFFLILQTFWEWMKWPPCLYLETLQGVTWPVGRPMQNIGINKKNPIILHLSGPNCETDSDNQSYFTFLRSVSQTWFMRNWVCICLMGLICICLLMLFLVIWLSVNHGTFVKHVEFVKFCHAFIVHLAYRHGQMSL